jgi:hypothetical protein
LMTDIRLMAGHQIDDRTSGVTKHCRMLKQEMFI